MTRGFGSRFWLGSTLAVLVVFTAIASISRAQEIRVGNVEALGNQPEVGQVDALQAELEALRRENDALRAKEGAVNLSQVFQKAASFLIVAIARMLTSFLDVIITIVTWSGWKTGFNAVTDAFGSLLSSQPVQAAHGFLTSDEMKGFFSNAWSRVHVACASVAEAITSPETRAAVAERLTWLGNQALTASAAALDVATTVGWETTCLVGTILRSSGMRDHASLPSSAKIAALVLASPLLYGAGSRVVSVVFHAGGDEGRHRGGHGGTHHGGGKKSAAKGKGKGGKRRH